MSTINFIIQHGLNISHVQNLLNVIKQTSINLHQGFQNGKKITHNWPLNHWWIEWVIVGGGSKTIENVFPKKNGNLGVLGPPFHPPPAPVVRSIPVLHMALVTPPFPIKSNRSITTSASLARR